VHARRATPRQARDRAAVQALHGRTRRDDRRPQGPLSYQIWPFLTLSVKNGHAPGPSAGSRLRESAFACCIAAAVRERRGPDRAAYQALCRDTLHGSFAEQVRRVQLVRRDGRDVSTLYGRGGGGEKNPRRARALAWPTPGRPVARPAAPSWRSSARCPTRAHLPGPSAPCALCAGESSVPRARYHRHVRRCRYHVPLTSPLPPLPPTPMFHIRVRRAGWLRALTMSRARNGAQEGSRGATRPHR
jgi:hypothetical protein